MVASRSALGVIHSSWDAGRVSMVWVDETRPPVEGEDTPAGGEAPVARSAPPADDTPPPEVERETRVPQPAREESTDPAVRRQPGRSKVEQQRQ